MRRIVEQVPVETVIVIPFTPLTEFTAHEQQLFPRMPYIKP
jgi:hypothetical protein